MNFVSTNSISRSSLKMKCIILFLLINYRDDRVIFILDGIISINKRHYGKIARVSTTGTLGED